MMIRLAKHLDLEECWILVGQRRGAIWRARPVRYRIGRPAEVAADARWALRREERRRDVVGFLHTHPSGPLSPSRRDVRTLRAWCGAFGKPLLCAIASPAGIAGFRFDDHRSHGRRLRTIELFDDNTLIGVDHGRQIPSRTTLPRRRCPAAAG